MHCASNLTGKIVVLISLSFWRQGTGHYFQALVSNIPISESAGIQQFLKKNFANHRATLLTFLDVLLIVLQVYQMAVGRMVAQLPLLQLPSIIVCHSPASIHDPVIPSPLLLLSSRTVTVSGYDRCLPAHPKMV